MNTMHYKVLNLINELKYLSEATNDINQLIPDYYLKFLLSGNPKQYNGKVFDFKVNGKKQQSDIAAFFTLLGPKVLDIEYHFNIVKDRLPEAMLPIAHDSTGNLVLLNFKSGRVYFWDHEIEKAYLISSSFTEFLNNLHD
jgi:hypothetical protein